jgi:GNAT superfamily N-acetyltransferase
VAVRYVQLFSGLVPDLGPPRAGEVCWRRTDAVEARGWVARRPATAEERRMYAVALAEGHWLIVAEEQGLEIGHRWVGFQRAYVPWPFRCDIVLPGDTGYLYDVFVSDSHRGRGLGADAVWRALREVRSAGLTRCAAWVLAKNHASLASWRRLGLHERRVIHLKLPKVQRWLPSQPWRDAGIFIRQNPGLRPI